ncbi:hypothetical protein OH76DRAFT_263643 [Lentinus brumalis]|uniref:Uncharacterized protein n=1 Tax=Lentinus brumalis TaxID=2498619 RepID=A0A371DGN1_9APHY|nr:hypothetical protein OH76DRAFT_263643 [Polyporus brumalis]
MPQCVLTFGDPPTRCIFAKCKKSEYCKAHYDEYYEMKDNYHCAAEEVAIMGRSLVVASEVHRTPLERREHVQAAVNMIMWYVMNMDQEAHWRLQHNAKFFARENERHNERLAELEKLRADGIALMKKFRARYDCLAARDKDGQFPEEVQKVVEETRSLWQSFRQHWHAHLRTFGGHGNDEDVIVKQVDEEMGPVPEV